MEFTSFNSDYGRSEFGNNFDGNLNKINALKSLLLGHELGAADINQLKEFKIVKEFLDLPFNDKREVILKKLFAVAVNIAIKNKTFPIELKDTSSVAIASMIDEGLNRVKVAYLSSVGQMDVIEAADVLIDRAAARTVAVLEKAVEKAGSMGFSGKNISEKSTYTGSLAEQDIKGVITITFRLSCSVSSARVAIMAGTVQPNPRIMGKNALPDSPTFPIMPSIT